MVDFDEPVSVAAVDIIREAVRNRKAERLVESLAKAPAGAIVEIGCLRTVTEVASDGWSTFYLAQKAAEQGRAMFSFDLDPHSVRIANQVLEQAGSPVRVLEEDGVAAIKGMEKGSIAFLYLDGSDNPDETLEQFQAARTKLAAGAVICVDDVQMYGWELPHGKASKLIPFLDAQGTRYTIHPTHPGFSMLVFTNNARVTR